MGMRTVAQETRAPGALRWRRHANPPRIFAGQRRHLHVLGAPVGQDRPRGSRLRGRPGRHRDAQRARRGGRRRGRRGRRARRRGRVDRALSGDRPGLPAAPARHVRRPRLRARRRRRREPRDLASLEGARIGVPGLRTTAYLVLRLLLPRFEPVVVPISPYSRAFEAVRSGEVDAALLIHEGRLTYEREGFACVCDLGAGWSQRHGGPAACRSEGTRSGAGSAPSSSRRCRAFAAPRSPGRSRIATRRCRPCSGASREATSRSIARCSIAISRCTRMPTRSPPPDDVRRAIDEMYARAHAAGLIAKAHRSSRDGGGEAGRVCRPAVAQRSSHCPCMGRGCVRDGSVTWRSLPRRRLRRPLMKRSFCVGALVARLSSASCGGPAPQPTSSVTTSSDDPGRRRRTRLTCSPSAWSSSPRRSRTWSPSAPACCSRRTSSPPRVIASPSSRRRHRLHDARSSAPLYPASDGLRHDRHEHHDEQPVRDRLERGRAHRSGPDRGVRQRHRAHDPRRTTSSSRSTSSRSSRSADDEPAVRAGRSRRSATASTRPTDTTGMTAGTRRIKENVALTCIPERHHASPTASATRARSRC